MNIFDDDLDDVKAETDTGSADGSIFLSKSLVDDKDYVLCVLAEKPVRWLELDNYDTSYEAENRPQRQKRKFAANFAIFNDEGEFTGMKIWETGPKHMNRLIDDRSEQGKTKLYKLTRNGVKQDKQTYYTFYAQRDLTPEEMETIKTAPKHEIRAGAQTAEYSDEFKRGLSAEIARLQWSKVAWKTACATYFGEYKAPEDMSPIEQANVLADLKALPDGSAPEGLKPKGEPGVVDLSDDGEDFF